MEFEWDSSSQELANPVQGPCIHMNSESVRKALNKMKMDKTAVCSETVAQMLKAASGIAAKEATEL